uniref:Adrenodoxin-like protein n=2 Tax=Hirondellea gigas TaxID=1518452 RepID=A0A6A7FVZ6_9CRUS
MSQSIALLRCNRIFKQTIGLVMRRLVHNEFRTAFSLSNCNTVLSFSQPRFLSTTTKYLHGEYERLPPKSEEDVVNITVVDRDGIEFAIRGKVGDNVMMLAQNHDVDIEGACEASLACCTCHVYVEDPYFERLDEADMKEEDLLDMAPFLAENSRLSCQIVLRKDLDGMQVRLPVGTRNMRVDTKGQQAQQEADER